MGSAAKEIINRIEEIADRLSVVESNVHLQQQETITALKTIADETQYTEKIVSERRNLRITAVGRALGRIQTLMNADQETTEQCPCGNHHGIKFFTTYKDGSTIIHVENMCPVEWWRKQHRMAVHLKDRKWLKNNPMKEFLEWYQIKK